MRAFIASIILLAACGEPWQPPPPRAATVQRCVSQEDRDKLSDFVSMCIRDANPKSDEEPEDWIKQCESTGISMICPIVPAVSVKRCDTCWWVEISCAEIREPELKSLCPDEQG